MKAGVLSVQGASPEHLDAFRRAMFRLGEEGEAVAVRSPEDLSGLDCLAIPGGESTTISKLIRRFGLFDGIVEMALSGVPIMGTCAGCVLLAKEGDGEVLKTGTQQLGLMDMAVIRNAYGRQRESFEADVRVEGLRDPFPAVFIRAPVINRVWGECHPLSSYEGRVVVAAQKNMLAVSFHPELSGDTRIHEMLIRMTGSRA
jgi:pyridoxal 5'-phosphate synthase pdxT subunit